MRRRRRAKSVKHICRRTKGKGARTCGEYVDESRNDSSVHLWKLYALIAREKRQAIKLINERTLQLVLIQKKRTQKARTKCERDKQRKEEIEQIMYVLKLKSKQLQQIIGLLNCLS